MYPTVREVQREAWRNGAIKDGVRFVPDEIPIAMTCNGGSQAAMMATPQDLENFAIGFTLNEGLVERIAEIENLAISEAVGSAPQVVSDRGAAHARIALLTSRVSVETVQKAATIGASALVSVSAYGACPANGRAGMHHPCRGGASEWF